MLNNPGFAVDERIEPYTRMVVVRPHQRVSAFVEGREHPELPQQTKTIKGMQVLIERITGMRFDYRQTIDNVGDTVYIFKAI